MLILTLQLDMIVVFLFYIKYFEVFFEYYFINLIKWGFFFFSYMLH